MPTCASQTLTISLLLNDAYLGKFSGVKTESLILLDFISFWETLLHLYCNNMNFTHANFFLYFIFWTYEQQSSACYKQKFNSQKECVQMVKQSMLINQQTVTKRQSAIHQGIAFLKLCKKSWWGESFFILKQGIILKFS